MDCRSCGAHQEDAASAASTGGQGWAAGAEQLGYWEPRLGMQVVCRAAQVRFMRAEQVQVCRS